MIENNVEITTNSTINVNGKCSLCVLCIICGDGVELTSNEEMMIRCGNYIVKVCDKCKNAVMQMRLLTQHEDK